MNQKHGWKNYLKFLKIKNFPNGENLMKLKQGDKIRSEDSVYEVVAVVLSTVYLRAVDYAAKCDYTMAEVHEKYRDIELIQKGKIQ